MKARFKLSSTIRSVHVLAACAALFSCACGSEFDGTSGTVATTEQAMGKNECGPDEGHGYGEHGGEIEVACEGQAPLHRPDHCSCACDRESPPGTVEEFVNCFHDDLARWGVDIAVQDGDVVSSTGERYAKQQFRDEFTSSVYLEVKDVARADVIVRAYDEHLRPVLRNSELRAAMQWWILRYYRFFTAGVGTIDDFIVDYPNKLSLYENLSALDRGGRYYGAFKAFIEQVMNGYYAISKFPTKVPGAQPVVRVVTGPYGGGHASVAATVTTSLTGTYDVKTVDECRSFSGPLDVMTAGKYRACLLYNDVEIKEANPDKAKLLGHLNWLLSFYILPDQRGGLRRALVADGTDLVLSSVHHLWDITAVGTAMGRPTLVAVTDYSFPAGQYFDVNHVNQKLVQYLVPTTRREFFRPMMLEYYDKSWEARVGSARTAYIHNQLFTGVGAPELTPALLTELGVFNPLGFPVNAAMRPPTDAADIQASKKVLGMGTNASRKIVSIGFGSTADPVQVRALLEQLLGQRDRFAHPIQLGIVTGGNQTVVDFAIPFFQENGIPVDSTAESDSNPFPQRITARVFGRLTQEEIANLYRASDAYVSKAGGATTAELIASSTSFVRGFGLWSWEYENALWLTKLGLSSETPPEPADPLALDTSFLALVPSTTALIDEINETIVKPRLFGPVPGALRYDAEQLKSVVAKMLGQTTSPAKVVKNVVKSRRPNTTMPSRGVVREGIVLR